MNFSKCNCNRFIAQLHDGMNESYTYGIFKLFKENFNILVFESD